MSPRINHLEIVQYNNQMNNKFTYSIVEYNNCVLTNKLCLCRQRDYGCNMGRLSQLFLGYYIPPFLFFSINSVPPFPLTMTPYFSRLTLFPRTTPSQRSHIQSFNLWSNNTLKHASILTFVCQKYFEVVCENFQINTNVIGCRV